MILLCEANTQKLKPASDVHSGEELEEEILQRVTGVNSGVCCSEIPPTLSGLRLSFPECPSQDH